MSKTRRNSEAIFKPNAISILIVDDHPMVRDGIKAMLNNQRKQIQFLIEDAEEGDTAVKRSCKKTLTSLYSITISQVKMELK